MSIKVEKQTIYRQSDTDVILKTVDSSHVFRVADTSILFKSVDDDTIFRTIDKTEIPLSIIEV
jgi:hypothetical protein